MTTLRLYHGTARGFVSFDDKFPLRGVEPNSALGIHLTEHPWLAAHYAMLGSRDAQSSLPRVLVLDVEISKAAVVSSAEDFLGRSMEMTSSGTAQVMSREMFAAARSRLEAEGFHAVAVDSPIEDICGTWTVFDPSRIRIVEVASAEQAQNMESTDLDWDGVEMTPVSLFDTIEIHAPSIVPGL